MGIESLAKTALIAIPDIGSGHAAVAHALATELSSENNSIGVLTLSSGWLTVAKTYHLIMTSDAETSINYIDQGKKTRNGFWTNWLVDQLTKELTTHSQVTVITSQDHVAKAARRADKKVIHFHPDSHPKAEYNDSQHHVLTWVGPTGNHHSQTLVSPIDLLKAFKSPEVTPNRSEIWIKLSGSGGDPTVVKQIVHSFKKQTQPVRLVAPDFFGAMGATRFSEAQYYHSVAKAPQQVICFPSEQIMFLAQQSNSIYPPSVISFYPRGEHELNNLAEAITQGLTHAIICPLTLQTKLASHLAAKSIPPDLYRFIAPNKVSSADFVSAERWDFPPEAIPIAQAIIALIAQA